MSLFHNHPDFYNHPILLSGEFKKDPASFLNRFFGDYSLSDLRAMHAEILEVCLTTKAPPFDIAEKRADLILLFKNMECLWEAAFLLEKRK